MTPQPAHQKPSLNTAYLPGVGHVETPKREHYRAAINYLVNEIRRAPVPRKPGPGHPPPDPREDLAHRFWDTLRRLEWARRA